MGAATAPRGAGHIRISAPPSVASAIINPRVGAFLQANPEVTMDFFVTSALPDVVRHRIDAAIVLREWPGVKMANRELGRMKRVLCASPAYLEEAGTPLLVSDLHEHRGLKSLLSGNPEPWTHIENGERKQIESRTIMSSDNGDCLREACISGLGIANLYEFHARESLLDGSLVRLLPDVEIEGVGLYVMLPHEKHISASTSAFLDFLRRKLKNDSEMVLSTPRDFPASN